MENSDKLITVAQAAEMLSCSPSKIYALNRKGKIKLVKIGYRSTRVSESEIRQFMTSPRIVRQPPPPTISPVVGHRRLRTDDAARYVGLKTAQLSHLRQKGEGPPFIKIKHLVLYDTRVLDEWLDANTRTSTQAG
jgi:excisionase family DNA binding protein